MGVAVLRQASKQGHLTSSSCLAGWGLIQVTRVGRDARARVGPLKRIKLFLVARLVVLAQL